jgi:hypothetical protein
MTHNILPDQFSAVRIAKAPALRAEFTLVADSKIGVLTGDPPPGTPAMYPKALYIRVGMLTGSKAPIFRLKTLGPGIYLRSDKQAVFEGPRHTGYAGDAWVEEQPGNSYLVTVRLVDGASVAFWTLGISNQDDRSDACFAVVLADNVDETSQPWNDTAPLRKHRAIEPIRLGCLAIAVDTSNGQAYVVQDMKVTAVADPAHPLEAFVPKHAAVDPETHEIYIAVSAGAQGPEVDVVPRIPLGAGESVKTVAVFERVPPGGVITKVPSEIVLDHASRTLYSAIPGRVAVTDLDIPGPPTEIVTGDGRPFNLILDANTETVYALCSLNSLVQVCEIRDRVLQRRFNAGINLRALALGRDRRALYVAVEKIDNNMGPGICVVNTEGPFVPYRLPLGERKPMAMAVDDDRYIAYVLCDDSQLAVVDLRRLRIAEFVPVAKPPTVFAGTVAIDPSGPKVYIRSAASTIAVVVPVS